MVKVALFSVVALKEAEIRVGNKAFLEGGLRKEMEEEEEEEEYEENIGLVCGEICGERVGYIIRTETVRM